MEKNTILMEQSGKFTHRNRGLILTNKQAIVVLLTSFVLLCIMLLLSIMFRFTITTNHTLSEAKNAEFALRILATEYYGMDLPIYDPLTPDGLAEGVGQEVAELSGAEGELVLGSWDAARRAPRSFTYTKDKIVVVFNYDEQSGNCWKMYYQFRKVALPGWTVQAETTAAKTPPVSASD